MTTTVTVNVEMGFTALSGGTYLGLSVSDQKNFKSHFISNMEDSTEGIPASERSGWLGFSHTADDDGHIAEPSIESELAVKLENVGTAGADFGLVSGGPGRVQYVFRDNKRYCIHIYDVKRKIGAGSFQDWVISKTYGSSAVNAQVEIEFSWPTPY